MSQSSQSETLSLPLDAFIRSVGVNRRSPHALFLGAGASISSEVPSAGMCIWEWKRQIFVTKNPHVESQLRDLSISSVQQKIQGWLDAEGCYPPLDSAEEYSFYAERCYPIAADRRQYFQSLAEQAAPYIGYKMVCLLAEAGIIKSVWTTNFDQLVTRTASSFKITPIEVGLDTAHRALRMPADGELLSVALHGDYRYDKLKNTALELRRQDEALRAAMIESLRNTTLIVSGYSGRDRLTMEALEKAYSEPAPGRLFWCGREGGEPDEPIQRLLLMARACGREAFYVPTFGFDDMMLRLALHCLSGESHSRALEISTNYPDAEEGKSPPFVIESRTVARLIKSNAFSIECPGEVFEFKCPELNVKGAWKLLRTMIAGTNIAAVLLKGKVLAFGIMDEVKRIFAGKIEGTIERTPISEKELSYSDSVLTSLLTESAVRALAALRGLKTDGRRLIWTEEMERTARAYGQRCKVYDAVTIFLRRYAGKQYLVLKPTIHATGTGGEEISNETLQEIKRQLLTKQYNSLFNDATNKWRDRLFPAGETRFEFPPQSGSPFQFNVSRAPSFASVADL
jgi:SIR2-like domain